MTILRDRTTSREDFIFFTDRLSTLLVEKAMELLPHITQQVVTPIEEPYVGKKLDANVSFLEFCFSILNLNIEQALRCFYTEVVSGLNACSSHILTNPQ